MKTSNALFAVASALLILSAPGCSSESAGEAGGARPPSGQSTYYPGSSNEDYFGPPPGVGAATDTGGSASWPGAPDVGEPRDASAADTSATWEPVEPEDEVVLPYGAPEPGQNTVFVVHRDRGQVVVVDAESLAIHIVEVGSEPITVRALAGRDEAVVLNRGSSDLSWVRVTGGGVTVTSAPVVEGVNTVVTSPDGASAVAFYDSRITRPGDPAGSFQEVSLIQLGADGALKSVPVAVGFRPVDVVFRDDGLVAHVVTEQGVSLVDTKTEDERLVAPPVAVAPDAFEAVTEREVLVAGDGSVAVVRVLGKRLARVVPLDGSPLVELPLPGDPTDLDLLPDGKTALMVLRARQSAVILIVETALTAADPSEALTEVDLSPARPGLAAVTKDGSAAVLYTTVEPDEEVTVIDFVNAKVKRVPLKKEVKAVAIAPDSETALLLHEPNYGTGAEDEVERLIDRAEGYSILRLKDAFAKLELLDSPPGAFSFTSDGSQLFLLEPRTPDGRHLLRRVDLETTVESRVYLASTPTDVRYVPAAMKAAVFQEHPTGRITFVDAEGEEVQTLTGFELNALVD